MKMKATTKQRVNLDSPYFKKRVIQVIQKMKREINQTINNNGNNKRKNKGN